MLSSLRRSGGFRDADSAIYHVVCWEEDDGNSEVVDYDASGCPLRRVLIVHTDEHWAISGPSKKGLIRCDDPEPSEAFIRAQ